MCIILWDIYETDFKISFLNDFFVIYRKVVWEILQFKHFMMFASELSASLPSQNIRGNILTTVLMTKYFIRQDCY